jgi:hypothetical protein
MAMPIAQPLIPAQSRKSPSGARRAETIARSGKVSCFRTSLPGKPTDAPAVHRLLVGSSERSRWLRFFSDFPDLAKAATWATRVDSDRAEVLTENHKVLQVLRDCGYPVKVRSLRGAQLVELDTSQAATPQEPREPRTKAA